MGKLSTRANVEPFHAMDVLANAGQLAAAGKDVISMAVGQPAAKAPELVRLAAADAALNVDLGYTSALGRDATRQAIAQHYRDAYGLVIPASRIAVTTGSSAGFSLAFLALTDPGGRVAIASPGYPAYRNIISALSLECVEIPTGGSAFDVDALIKMHSEKPIDVLLFASPANPTGAIIDDEAFQILISTCADLGIRLLSDEIYHRLRYDGEDRCALEFDDNVIVINSFSKFYCMTGWRIGWMVLPQEMVRPIERLAQSLYISAPDISQIAAPFAFGASEELVKVRKNYERNRTMLMERLPGLGLPFAAQPGGAFYAWIDVSQHSNDSMDFARRMLNEIYVAGAPGVDFDLNEGHRTMRLSYAGDSARMEEAIDRIEKWI